MVGAVARMADGKLMAKADNGKSGGVAGIDSPEPSGALILCPSIFILLLPIILSAVFDRKGFSNL